MSKIHFAFKLCFIPDFFKVISLNVKKGSKVKTGDVLVILEAMKMMNQVTAEQAGTIIEILVEHSEPVEFGQPLFIIK